MVLVTQIPITLLHRRTSETCYFLNLAPGYMDTLFMEIHWDVHLKIFMSFMHFLFQQSPKIYMLPWILLTVCSIILQICKPQLGKPLGRHTCVTCCVSIDFKLFCTAICMHELSEHWWDARYWMCYYCCRHDWLFLPSGQSSRRHLAIT